MTKLKINYGTLEYTATRLVTHAQKLDKAIESLTKLKIGLEQQSSLSTTKFLSRLETALTKMHNQKDLETLLARAIGNYIDDMKAVLAAKDDGADVVLDTDDVEERISAIKTAYETLSAQCNASLPVNDAPRDEVEKLKQANNYQKLENAYSLVKQDLNTIAEEIETIESVKRSFDEAVRIDEEHAAYIDALLGYCQEYASALTPFKRDEGVLEPKGVMYLNKQDGAFGQGHAAMLVLYKDGSGTLYSYVGDAEGLKGKATAVLGPYNDANVNTWHYSKEQLKKIFSTSDDGYYDFYKGLDETIQDNLKNSKHAPWDERYNRGVYIPVTPEQGKKIEEAVNTTILKTNGQDRDKDPYNLVGSNCNQHAISWIEAAGIDLPTEEHWESASGNHAATYEPIIPNEAYEHAESNVENGQVAGDLGHIWKKINE